MELGSRSFLGGGSHEQDNFKDPKNCQYHDVSVLLRTWYYIQIIIRIQTFPLLWRVRTCLVPCPPNTRNPGTYYKEAPDIDPSAAIPSTGESRHSTLFDLARPGATAALFNSVVAVLTLTRIIKSVVTGQAPVTLELRNAPGKKIAWRGRNVPVLMLQTAMW